MKKILMFASAAAAIMVMQSCKKNESEAVKTLPLASVNSDKRLNGPVGDYNEYKISNVSGGKFIEVSGNPTNNNEKFKNARKLEQYSAVSNDEQDPWQRWYVIYKTTVGGVKYYHIRNSFSGKLMDVPGATNVSGTQVEQYQENEPMTDNQLWRITEIGTTGQYNIVNKGNGLYLANQNGSSNNGNPIIQETNNGNNRQKWIFTIRFQTAYRDDKVVRFFERNNTSQGSVAFDQGNSIPLTWSSNNGKVLWVTQDAWDGSALQPNSMFNCNAWFQYGNSMFIQPSTTNWSNGTGAPNITRNGNRQTVDIQPNNSFAWPGVGVEVGQHVYVHVGEGNGLAMSNQTIWDFTQSTGTAWTASRLTPAGMSGQTTINYSVGMAKPGDGFVYSFGNGSGNAIYVARFPQNSPNSWTFWNGSSWQSTPTTAAAAVIGTGGDNTTISYVPQKNKYLMMTMTQGFLCWTPREISVATSNNVTGPFGSKTKVWTIQEYLNGNHARYYTPSIHPEHDNGRDEILLTYCLNYDACGQGSCSGSYLDPYYYRVKAIRVPYYKAGL